MGKLVCGFNGVGKSYAQKHCKSTAIYDLDSDKFKKNKDWASFYVECARQFAEKYDIVLLTPFDCVMKELNSKKLDWYLVYPNENMKDVYYERASKRNKSEQFKERFFEKWDDHLKLLNEVECPNKIVLKVGEYLSNYIKKIK